METGREERLARNEAVFREVNERIRDVTDTYASDGHVYEFLRECADTSCTDRIRLISAEYERIRRDPKQFVLAPGHDLSAIEAVIEVQPEHVVVEKTGTAAEVVEALDPHLA
jgi:hypothetical protein